MSKTKVGLVVLTAMAIALLGACKKDIAPEQQAVSAPVEPAPAEAPQKLPVERKNVTAEQVVRTALAAVQAGDAETLAWTWDADMEVVLTGVIVCQTTVLREVNRRQRAGDFSYVPGEAEDCYRSLTSRPLVPHDQMMEIVSAIAFTEDCRVETAPREHQMGQFVRSAYPLLRFVDRSSPAPTFYETDVRCPGLGGDLTFSTYHSDGGWKIVKLDGPPLMAAAEELVRRGEEKRRKEAAEADDKRFR